MSVHAASIDGERRQSPRRCTVAEHGIETGRDASVLNISNGGMLIETLHRLLPGTTIDVQLWLADRRTAISGCVVRSTVASLRLGPVLYHGAVAFDRPLALFPPNSQQSTVDGYPVPSPNATENRHDREDVTPPTL